MMIKVSSVLTLKENEWKERKRKEKRHPHPKLHDNTTVKGVVQDKWGHLTSLVMFPGITTSEAAAGLILLHFLENLEQQDAWRAGLSSRPFHLRSNFTPSFSSLLYRLLLLSYSFMEKKLQHEKCSYLKEKRNKKRARKEAKNIRKREEVSTSSGKEEADVIYSVSLSVYTQILGWKTRN